MDRSKCLVDDREMKPVEPENIISGYPFGKNIVPTDASNIKVTLNR